MSSKTQVKTAFACTSCGVPLAVEDRASAKVLAGVMGLSAGASTESFVIVNEGTRKKKSDSGAAAGNLSRQGTLEDPGRQEHLRGQRQQRERGIGNAVDDLTQEELNERVALFKASESYASGRTLVQHPLCEDCTEMTLRELERDHDKAMSEHSKYAAFLEELERESAEDMKAKAESGDSSRVAAAAAATSAAAAEEEAKLVAEVQALEEELRRVRSERLRVSATARALDGAEQRMCVSSPLAFLCFLLLLLPFSQQTILCVHLLTQVG